MKHFLFNPSPTTESNWFENLNNLQSEMESLSQQYNQIAFFEVFFWFLISDMLLY